MTDQNNFHNNQTNFIYNIDIYKLVEIFLAYSQHHFNHQFSLNLSYHEFCVARARIPCDQIPEFEKMAN